MSGPSSQALWELFLDEASVRVERGLALLDEPEATSPEAQSRRLLGGLLATVAAEALLMGVEEVGLLAQELERAALRPGPAGALRAPLQLLDQALQQLRAPDASGAHLDPAPLRQAAQALREGAAPARPTAPPAAAESTSPAEEVWLPQVDEDLVEPFIEECGERIESLATHLVELETTQDPELVRTIFRDLHTLKGSSGFVGLARMNRLAHAAEDLVGEVRDGRCAADRSVTDALLAALDGLRAILDRAAARAPIDVPVDPLIARLRSPGRSEAEAAAPPPAPGPPAAEPAALTLRVDFDKLDHLLNLVGELVLGKAGVHDVLAALQRVIDELESRRRLGEGNGTRAGGRQVAGLLQLLESLTHDLEDGVGRLDMVSSELRDQVMKLRMVPIAGLFNKYRRVVRDLSHSLGKEVALEIRGADTELDKLLVERLDDPLLHLVRNAVDHGLELPDRRVAAGKPASGRVVLAAAHRGHQMVIEVSDDGAGIDAARVAAKAVDRGLVTADDLARMDRRQQLELIFTPGLSTSAEVTGLSGRGVGMDVVREAITELKGTIDIDSTPGSGTRFELRLPLTLAISNVLLCKAGGEVLALPIHAVKHTLMADPAQARTVAACPTLLLDQEVPLVDVAATLGLPHGERPPPFPVALVESVGGTFGLVFEELLGRQEIVIKSLGSLLERVPCCAGATLLGARCALILDVPALIRRALESPARRGARPGPAPVSPQSRPTVLVVEDSDTVREDLRRLLAAEGLAVHDARDGAAALTLAEQRRYDLVSTDVTMPGMDGYELCRRLRGLPLYEQVPIVMLTSRDQEIDRLRGFDAGVDAYLVKPIDRSEMIALVRRLLDRAASGEEAEP